MIDFLRTTVCLTVMAVALAACEPATPEEKAKADQYWVEYNSKNRETGIVGKIDGCTVYRMYNSGAGETYIFFTKCGDDVNTQWTTGSKTKHQNNVQTIKPPRN